jgi:putative addiction module component (TIGR02574 family)
MRREELPVRYEQKQCCFSALLDAFSIDQDFDGFPSSSRALLAERLVESLDVGAVDEMQKVWAAEAVRRRDEVRTGQVNALPGEQVLEEVRRLLGR